MNAEMDINHLDGVR